MQSEACFEAMQIDWPVIRQQAIHRGVIMTRVAVRDFDQNDQVLIASPCLICTCLERNTYLPYALCDCSSYSSKLSAVESSAAVWQSGHQSACEFTTVPIWDIFLMPAKAVPPKVLCGLTCGLTSCCVGFIWRLAYAGLDVA